MKIMTEGRKKKQKKYRKSGQEPTNTGKGERKQEAINYNLPFTSSFGGRRERKGAIE